jgi:hypothetical protein
VELGEGMGMGMGPSIEAVIMLLSPLQALMRSQPLPTFHMLSLVPQQSEKSKNIDLKTSSKPNIKLMPKVMPPIMNFIFSL